MFVHTVIGRWSRDDAPLLAKEWLEQFNFMAFYKWVLIRIFREGFARRTSAAEALFLALYDSSISARVEDLAHVIEVLNGLMRERKSGLNSTRRRNELKFPAFP